MSLGGTPTNGDVQPNFTSLPVPTSTYGLPIAIGWGRTRGAPTLGDDVDFAKGTKSPDSAGGKGLGGGKDGQVDYTASILMFLGETCTAVRRVWKDQSQTTDLASLGFTFFNGAIGQAAWGYMATKHPERALGYGGRSYVAAENYDLGSSPNLSPHNMEISWAYEGTATWCNAYDADIAHIIYDLLTNEQYGARWPAGQINTATLWSTPAATTTGDATLQTWCRANGFGMSPYLSSAEPANTILQRWLDLILVDPVWDDGMLSFVPKGDTVIAANGVTYRPDTTIVAYLTDADFVGDASAEAVTLARTDPADVYNVQTVQYLDRGNSYNQVPAIARDQAAIEQNGNAERAANPISANEICDAAMALRVAYLTLQRQLQIRNTHTFRLSWEHVRVKPTKLIRIPAYDGSEWLTLRVNSVEEDDDGIRTVTAVEWLGGVMTVPAYANETVTNNPVNTLASVQPVNQPVIFEPPAEMVTAPQIWIGASGGSAGVFDPNWGGAQVHISTDGGAEYGYVGNITAPIRQGVLSALLAAFGGSNPDTTNTLAVDLRESGGKLEPTTDLNAMAGLTLCLVGDELLSFAAAGFTGTNQYALGHLYRGLHGTKAGAHAIGAQFARLDDRLFKFDLQPAFVGQTLWVKLVGFNIFGRALEDVSTVTAYSFVPTGRAFQDLQYLINQDGGVMIDQTGSPIFVNVAG